MIVTTLKDTPTEVRTWCRMEERRHTVVEHRWDGGGVNGDRGYKVRSKTAFSGAVRGVIYMRTYKS